MLPPAQITLPLLDAITGVTILLLTTMQVGAEVAEQPKAETVTV
jgi:hypothetical protein